MFLIQATANDYDPWLDTNDDGAINIFDVVDVATRYGTTGTPINKTQLLLELLNKVETHEEKLDQAKMIRFYEPSETTLEVPAGGPWTPLKNASQLFTWTPQNTSNNAVLFCYWWFEYESNITDPPPEHYISVTLNAVADEWHWSFEHHVYFHYFIWNKTKVIGASYVPPNCSSYQLWFQVRGYAFSVPFVAVVRNLNVVLNVMDGLAVSS